jgi:hypothetical protein
MLMLHHYDHHHRTNMPSLHPPLLEPQADLPKGTETAIMNPLL